MKTPRKLATKPVATPTPEPPASTPSSVSSAPGATTPPSAPRFAPPPEFSGLSPAQLDYIHDHLRENSYKETQLMLFTELGIQISINKLFRYYKKLELAERLEISQDTPDAVQQLLNLYHGRPVDIDRAGLETIKRRALELALASSTKPSLLLQLQRIFTWEHRQSLDEHRKLMDLEKAAYRQRLAAVAERRAQVEEDHLKLLARRQTHLENEKKQKNSAADFPQTQITQFFQDQLSQPWPPATEESPASPAGPVEASPRDARG